MFAKIKWSFDFFFRYLSNYKNHRKNYVMLCFCKIFFYYGITQYHLVILFAKHLSVNMSESEQLHRQTSIFLEPSSVGWFPSSMAWPIHKSWPRILRLQQDAPVAEAIPFGAQTTFMFMPFCIHQCSNVWCSLKLVLYLPLLIRGFLLYFILTYFVDR